MRFERERPQTGYRINTCLASPVPGCYDREKLLICMGDTGSLKETMTLFCTDQDCCFNEEGKPVPCTGTGQDGESWAGTAWPAPRFSCSGDLVRDRV